MTRRTQTPWETTLALKFPPLAVFYANEIPPNARPLVGRCAAFALAQAARGETVYVDLENCRCPGAVGGLALGPFASERFPCGASGFERFFSTGFAGWPPGDEALAQMEPAARRKFEKGEGYAPTPDAAKRYVASLPTVEPEGVCVVFKPLAKLTSNETPKAVVFLVDADALSALVVLANYVRGASTDAVRIPFASGCASVALFPFAEANRPDGEGRAIVGGIDVSARLVLRKALGEEIVAFAAPWELFQKMDASADESFLSRFVWRKILDSKRGGAGGESA